MKRFLNALKADIIFQFKQGFYYVYIFITVIYMVIMMKLPENLKSLAVPLTVFSDPSLICFFFIGGITMLEKVQGIIKYLSVTPLHAGEYLLSKAVSLSLMALTAGVSVTVSTYREPVNWFLLISGTLLTSVFFTLYGFVAAAKSRTINQYFIAMVPYLLLIILPCFSLIGFKYDFLISVFPSVAGLKLVMGAFRGIDPLNAALCYLVLIVMIFAVMGAAEKKYNDITVSEEA